jgi:hypothetical protein
MWSTVLGFALLLLLGVAILPVPRVRRWLLTGMARLGQAVVLGFLGACGTFFVKPQAAPDWLSVDALTLLEGTLGLAPDTASGWPWLVLAVLVVGISLPVLLVVELAVSLSSQTAQVQALRQEVHQAAAWIDGRLAGLGASGPAYSALLNEAAAASEALRSAGHAGNQSPSDPAPLVLDLLK